MITSAAGPRRALGDAEQRAHAEFLHRLDVEDLDLDAELAQLAGAAREFLGEKDVRRLVDEIARGDHAIDDVGVGANAFRAVATSATAIETSARKAASSPSFFLVL